MDYGQRVFRLSPDAEKIIKDRVGCPTSKGGPNRPSPSMVLSSIVLRYQGMVDITSSKMLRKFSVEELEAIYKWIMFLNDAHQSVVKVDTTDHIDVMANIIIDGERQCPEEVLDFYKRRALIRIVGKNLRPLEAFAIADTVATRLSLKNRATSE